jgi:tRNA pseudouridine13 synthase
MSTDDSDQLPYATAKSLRLLGKIRELPEDFQVEEIPAYPPTGAGEHLMLRFEKTGLTTPEAVTRIALALGVDPAQAGWAGLKDRQAVTSQWITLFGGEPETARALVLPGVRVLEANRHNHKIRSGHLKGNRFVIRMRCDSAQTDIARAVMAELATSGAPNYYGEQRFGHGGQNVQEARRWIVEGRRAPRDRFRRKLLVSALQSEWFNRWLSARIERQQWQRALDGDLMRKEDTGGLFIASDLADAEARVSNWSISPTGPIFGAEMRWPERDALAHERALWESEGLSDTVLTRFRKLMPGSRRVARVRPSDVRVDPFCDGIEFAFTLPKGAYATVILREFLKSDAVEESAAEPANPAGRPSLPLPLA